MLFYNKGIDIPALTRIAGPTPAAAAARGPAAAGRAAAPIRLICGGKIIILGVCIE
jgi:hypothetical protein